MTPSERVASTVTLGVMRNVAFAFASMLSSTAFADEPAPPQEQPESQEAAPLPRPKSFLIPRPTQGPFAEVTNDDQPRKSRTPAIIATAATGTLLLASIAAWYRYDRILTDTSDVTGQTRDEVQEQIDRTQRWKYVGLGTFAAALVSCGVTGYMWSRLEYVPTMTIEPTNQSIRVAYTTAF
jgi:hypothetical protein